MSLLQKWLAALQKTLPSRESLAQHAWLKPVAHRLLDPTLWRMQKEAVARGVAIGTFWAFVIPLGQTFAAAAHCIWWRGNIPAAAVMTFLTNPLSFGFWLWLAYPVGQFFWVSAPATEPLSRAHWLSSLQEIGGPVLLGMGIFAVFGAALGYVLVKLGWRFGLVLRRLRRKKAASS